MTLCGGLADRHRGGRFKRLKTIGRMRVRLKVDGGSWALVCGNATDITDRSRISCYTLYLKALVAWRVPDGYEHKGRDGSWHAQTDRVCMRWFFRVISRWRQNGRIRSGAGFMGMWSGVAFERLLGLAQPPRGSVGP